MSCDAFEPIRWSRHDTDETIRQAKEHKCRLDHSLSQKTMTELTSDPHKLAYTIKQAVIATGIGRSKLYEMIRDGEIIAVKIPGQRLIERAELEALFAKTRAAASADRHVQNKGP